MIGTRYTRFHDDLQIEALGPAQDDAPCLSRLLFHWVNPLIEKGLSGHLKSIDDLFDLPESLWIHNTAERLQNAIALVPSLFRSLHRVFGLEFYAIGLLRFSSDMLGFAGPLLLSSLLTHKSDDPNESDWKSYAYASGLFATTLIGKLISNAEFELSSKIHKIFLLSFHFRRFFEYTFQLAHIIDHHENENGNHDRHLS